MTMTAALMQMFSAGTPKVDTVFDLDFDEVDIPEGAFFQVQFNISPRDGFDAVGVDWGDGNVQDWPRSQYTMYHNWSSPGRYRVRLDGRLRWFRFTSSYSVVNGRSRSARPLVRPVQWGDFVESAEGTYCGLSGTREGRGIQGVAIPWGRSIRNTNCCYQGATGLVGPFPKWGPSVTVCDGTYQYSGLGGNIPPWPKNAVSCDQCYMNTGASGAIPAWPATMESARRCYMDCANLDAAWTDDPELLMPATINRAEGAVTGHDDVVKGTGESLRALFYEEWGGTRERPEE